MGGPSRWGGEIDDEAGPSRRGGEIGDEDGPSREGLRRATWKTSKSMGFLLPLLVFGVSFIRVRICFGLQISYKISLHGERAHDVLCVMCEHTRVHYKET